MKKSFFFSVLHYSWRVVMPCIFILSLSLRAADQPWPIPEIIGKVRIIMTEPTIEEHKSLADFIDEILVLINQDQHVVQQWLSLHKLTLPDFLKALNDAKNARNILAVQRAFNKFSPILPESIKRVGFMTILRNVSSRLYGNR